MTTTILLITRDRLTRADFRSGRESRLLELTQDFAPPVADFPALVEAALRLSKRRPGRVWLLSTEVWTQTLALASESVAGLSQTELAKALAFEAEPFSGVSGLQSVCQCVELTGRRNERLFWLVLLPSGQLEQVDYVVQAAGGRLAGVGHPGGMPREMSADASPSPAVGPSLRGTSWTRVELWPGAVFCVRGDGGGSPSVRVINADPKPGRWQAEVDRWRAEAPAAAGHRALLATAAVALEEVQADTVTRLEDAHALEPFLTTWSVQLEAREPPVPLLVPPKRPASPAARRATAAVLALVAVAVCVGHYLWSEHMIRDLSVEIARLKQPADELSRIQKELETEQKRRKELQAESDKLAADVGQCRLVRSSLRQRVVTLLTELARGAAEDTIIRKIMASSNGVVVHGTCLDPNGADALFGSLARALEPLGWRVQLPRKQAQELLPDGGPWLFELHIEESQR